MPSRLDDFRSHRQQMNDRVLQLDHLGIKRFFNLDTAAYKDGALDSKTKELLGLAASAVLRCNDCIDYHLMQCVDAGWTDAELHDALNVALLVGGSIVIPHLRTPSKRSICCARKRDLFSTHPEEPCLNARK